MPKKVLVWGAVAFVLFYLASSPEQSAVLVRTFASWLRGFGEVLKQFLDALVK